MTKNNLLKFFNEKTRKYEFVINTGGIVFWLDMSGKKRRHLSDLKRRCPNSQNPFPVPVTASLFQQQNLGYISRVSVTFNFLWQLESL